MEKQFSCVKNDYAGYRVFYNLAEMYGYCAIDKDMCQKQRLQILTFASMVNLTKTNIFVPDLRFFQ
jgi:hypothetical protein